MTLVFSILKKKNVSIFFPQLLDGLKVITDEVPIQFDTGTVTQDWKKKRRKRMSAQEAFLHKFSIQFYKKVIELWSLYIL